MIMAGLTFLSMIYLYYLSYNDDPKPVKPSHPKSNESKHSISGFDKESISDTKKDVAKTKDSSKS